jgi:hypothetical protein
MNLIIAIVIEGIFQFKFWDTGSGGSLLFPLFVQEDQWVQKRKP